MVDLSEIAPSLTETEPGFFRAAAQEEISYPEDAHRLMADLEEKSFWFDHRASVLATVLDRHPAPGCLFDVGGGNGYMVRETRGLGVDSILVEPGEDGARTALARGLAPVVNATLASAGFRGETLAAVGLFDVLEHIEDDGGFLRDVRALLRPGGRVYITVPAFTVLWSADDVRAGHFRRYRAKSMRRVLDEAGLELEFSSYFFLSLTLPIFLVRSLPSRFGLRRAQGARRAEHARPRGIVGRLFDMALDLELRLLRRYRSPMGSSLFVVAKRASH